MVTTGSLPAPACPQVVVDLIERFGLHREAYRQPSYNETQVRREFIDPFFEALGWDVDNKEGYAEAYKDVIHEDAIKIGGFTKAPDCYFPCTWVAASFAQLHDIEVVLRATSQTFLDPCYLASNRQTQSSAMTNVGYPDPANHEVRDARADDFTGGRDHV